MAKINSLDDVFKALQEMFPDLEIETYEVKLNGTKDPDIKEIRIGDKKKEPEMNKDELVEKLETMLMGYEFAEDGDIGHITDAARFFSRTFDIINVFITSLENKLTEEEIYDIVNKAFGKLVELTDIYDEYKYEIVITPKIDERNRNN